MNGPCSCGADGSSYSACGSESHSMIAWPNARPVCFATQPVTGVTGVTSRSSNRSPASEESLTWTSICHRALSRRRERRERHCRRATTRELFRRHAAGTPAARHPTARGPAARSGGASARYRWRNVRSSDRRPWRSRTIPKQLLSAAERLVTPAARRPRRRVALEAGTLLERPREHGAELLERLQIAVGRRRERLLDEVVARDVDRVGGVHPSGRALGVGGAQARPPLPDPGLGERRRLPAQGAGERPEGPGEVEALEVPEELDDERLVPRLLPGSPSFARMPASQAS